MEKTKRAQTVSRALILAAGMGTRLLPLTEDRPKSLVPVNGTPILMNQIACLRENGISDITVISGCFAEVLEAAVHALYPDVHVVESVDYASTNNMYSALLGMEAMFPDGKMEPFLMMNADVFFDASVLTALLEDAHENAVVVDMGRYLEESMKVTERNGRLTAISKGIPPEDALGCSIDVYKFGVSGGGAFLSRCRDYIERRKERKLWSEVALNDAFADAPFHACPLSGRWLEIDNTEDLNAASALFA